MGFIDTYFRQIWISIITFIVSIFFLIYFFLFGPVGRGASDLGLNISWLILIAAAIALISASVPFALYGWYKLRNRARILPRSFNRTFE